MKTFGLGDFAYYLFKPLVAVIDFTWGTDLHSCEVCAARRKRWNRTLAVPTPVAITFAVTVCAIGVWLALR